MQQTASFTVTVAPAVVQNPLIITPSSGALPAETEGVATADQVAVVSGGTPPYTYAITGLPAGVTLSATTNPDGSDTIATSGTPAAGDAKGGDGAGNYTIGLTATDSAPLAAKATRTLKVGG